MTVLGQAVTSNPPCRDHLIARMSILQLSGVVFGIAAAWRFFDIFVFNLGDTWLNIMPSKVFPLLIMLWLFTHYRHDETASVLGLSKSHVRSNVAFGLAFGLSLYFLTDVVSVVIYGTFIDPSYSLALTILNPFLLWYQFAFFFTNAMLEETLFRGLLQNGFRQYMGPIRAILLSAFIFSLWHIAWPLVNGISDDFSVQQTAAMLVFAVLFGLLMGVYYERFSMRLSLAGPIVAHTLVNFFNENFKIGPEPAVQGPDVVYSTPGLMAVSTVLFLLTFAILLAVVWKWRLDDIERLWNRFTTHIRVGGPNGRESTAE